MDYQSFISYRKLLRKRLANIRKRNRNFRVENSIYNSVTTGLFETTYDVTEDFILSIDKELYNEAKDVLGENEVVDLFDKNYVHAILKCIPPTPSLKAIIDDINRKGDTQESYDRLSDLIEMIKDEAETRFENKIL